MEGLVQKHGDATYIYTQVERHGMYAIFCQEHRVSGIRRFEVIHILVRKARTWPDGRETSEHEAYPPSSAWGTSGWTFYTLVDAQARVSALVTRDAEKECCL